MANIFPLTPVQTSPMRCAYTWANIMAEKDRFTWGDGKEFSLLVRRTCLLTRPLSCYTCTKIEKHYARHNTLPGWAKDFFLNPEAHVFDNWMKPNEDAY